MAIAADTATRRRGRPPRIDLDQIVGAAIALGLDSFTMQGIADRLGVTSPALYSHVAGRDQVLDLANAELRARLEDFSSPAADWRAWLIDFAELIREHLAPSASTLMVDLHAPGTADQVGIGERGLQLLIDEGLSPSEAGCAVWLIFRIALTAGPEQRTSLSSYVDDTGHVLGPDPGGRLPATQAVHAAFVSTGPHDTFAFDLRVALDGLAARIASDPPQGGDRS